MGVSPEEEAATRRIASPNFDDELLAQERPVHEVAVSSFLIAKYEISQKTWHEVMNVNPSTIKAEGLPVHDITMSDCIEFCLRSGLQLPTEAQWEYACRARTRTIFYFGNSLDAKHATLAGGNPGNAPSVVTQNVPNGFGIHNMHGNVAEWCEDVFDPEFYKKSLSMVRDPLCRSGSDEYVIRGGCSADTAVWCRSSFRRGYGEPERTMFVGIRPVYPVP